MLNPDGRLWVDRLGEGLADTDERLSPADGECIIRLVAHHVGVDVHARNPRVSAELPETGERFEGLIRPVVAAPARSVEHTSELQSLMRISYAVFCLQKKTRTIHPYT